MVATMMIRAQMKPHHNAIMKRLTLNSHHSEESDRHNNNKNDTKITEFAHVPSHAQEHESGRPACIFLMSVWHPLHMSLHTPPPPLPPTQGGGGCVMQSSSRPCQANNVCKLGLIVRGGSLEARLGRTPGFPLWVPCGCPFLLRFMGNVPP